MTDIPGLVMDGVVEFRLILAKRVRRKNAWRPQAAGKRHDYKELRRFRINGGCRLSIAVQWGLIYPGVQSIDCKR